MAVDKSDGNRFNRELAENAYLQYGLAVNMTNFMCKPMPNFQDLPEETQQAWVRAAIYCYVIGYEDALK